MVNAGIQPIQNLGVLNEIGTKFGPEHKIPWGKWVIERGLDGKNKIVIKQFVRLREDSWRDYGQVLCWR